MGALAAMAEEHWRTVMPQAYAALPPARRAAVFEEIEEQAQAQIEEMADALAGPDRPGETFMARAGRLTEAEATARSTVIRELVLTEPTAVRDGDAEALRVAAEDPDETALTEAIREFWRLEATMRS
jgi:hypothetical protein